MLVLSRILRIPPYFSKFSCFTEEETENEFSKLISFDVTIFFLSAFILMLLILSRFFLMLWPLLCKKVQLIFCSNGASIVWDIWTFLYPENLLKGNPRSQSYGSSWNKNGFHWPTSGKLIPGLGGGGGIQSFIREGSTPRTNSLPFWQKRYLFRVPSVNKWYPLKYLV